MINIYAKDKESLFITPVELITRQEMIDRYPENDQEMNELLKIRRTMKIASPWFAE